MGERARKALACLFTAVRPVSELTARRVHQMHQPRFSDHYDKQGWLPKIFTKFHALGLVEYSKVCWLDADMFALQCPDSLFTLRTPAGVCSYYPWKVRAPPRQPGFPIDARLQMHVPTLSVVHNVILTQCIPLVT